MTDNIFAGSARRTEARPHGWSVESTQLRHSNHGSQTESVASREFTVHGQGLFDAIESWSHRPIFWIAFVATGVLLGLVSNGSLIGGGAKLSIAPNAAVTMSASSQDRSLVKGAWQALPVNGNNTKALAPSFVTPGPAANNSPLPYQPAQALQTGAALPPGPAPEQPALTTSPVPGFAPVSGEALAGAPPIELQSVTQDAYLIQQLKPTGTRIKTIVSR